MYKVGGSGSGQPINDIATKENLMSISTGIGNVQLLELGENNSVENISLVRTYDELAQFISLSRKYIYLNGHSIGAQVRDLETDHIIQEYGNHSRMNCNHRGNEIFLARQSRLNMWDIRFKEIRPIRSFDANKNSEYFERIKIHGSEFQISAFKCDDVKVACGKTNGDILLWDIRNESNPIWTKSTAIDCGLESSRGKAINYPRIPIKNVDFSLTKIFSISRYGIASICVL